MTDEEYLRFLTALARKHLRYPQPPSPPPPPYYPYLDQAADLRRTLDNISGTSRLLKVIRDREDPALLGRLVNDLETLGVS
jgi:hypothetical protein